MIIYKGHLNITITEDQGSCLINLFLLKKIDM